jgi:hypothetical protein
VAGCSDWGNEPSGFLKYRKFLDYLRNYELFKDSAPWNKVDRRL